MTCEQAAELLGPYLDDELPLEARRRVEGHLLTCQTCAWEMVSQRITRERLRDGIGETLAPDAFRARVLARIKADNGHLHTAHENNSDAPAQYPLPIGL